MGSWSRACSGTRAAHHRCTRATSSSGRATQIFSHRVADTLMEALGWSIVIPQTLPTTLGKVSRSTGRAMSVWQ
jgi:uncharacterized membrane protein